MSVFNSVTVWNYFRSVLDRIFGLYQKRITILWGFGIGRESSLFDIGCGTGQYSKIIDGDYYGIDMDPAYIKWAQKKWGNERKVFECVRLQDVRLVRAYDVALLVDLTHHISEADLRDFFVRLSQIASKHVVIFDPIRQSRWNLIGRLFTALDNGAWIRPKEKELSLVREYFDVLEVKDLKIFGIESIAILAKPKQ